jgi:hypothetical protein
LCLYGLLEWRPLGLAVPWVKGCGGTKMQREFAMRRLAKLEGYRLEKKGDDSYRLINARFNVAVYQLDGVPLEKIAGFLEKRTSQANSPDAQHR